MWLRVLILLGILGLIFLKVNFIKNSQAQTPDDNLENVWLSSAYDPESPFPLEARAGMVLNRYTGEIFFKKNEDLVLPIASLSKLMTAVVALESGDYDQGALRRMLIISDNQAADKLVGSKIALLNLKAKNLGMNNTYFEDASGLSPNNRSTVSDLLKLVNYSLRYPEIWEALSAEEYRGTKNTNELLGKYGIIAGKTGLTDEAGECLILLTKDLITIVLNASDRFEESKKLIELFTQ